MVCAPKRDGGLGFGPLRIMNQAPLGKCLWHVKEDLDGLWKQILVAYGSRFK